MFLISNKEFVVGKDAGGLEYIIEYQPFSNIDYQWMEWGCETFFIGMGNEQSVNVHKGYTCEVTKQLPIVGTMHFWWSYEGWHFVSQQGYEELKQEGEIPDICYATKYYISDIQNKFWSEYDSNKLLQDEPDDDYPKYFAFTAKNDYEITPQLPSTESDIFDYSAQDWDPLIYYRLSRPLKQYAYVPVLNLSSYHEENKDRGYKLKIAPITKLDFNPLLVDHYRYHYNQIVDSITRFGNKYNNDICQALDKYLAKNDLHLESLINTYEVNFEELEFSNLELRNLNTDEILPLINAIFGFNISFIEVIKYVVSEKNVINRISKNGPKSKTWLNYSWSVST